MKSGAFQIETLSRGFRVVALGGGTGFDAPSRPQGTRQSAVIDEHAAPTPHRRSRPPSHRHRMTAGSRGACAAKTGILPPGDIRNCMGALTKD